MFLIIMKKVLKVFKKFKYIPYVAFLNISCEKPRCVMTKHIRETHTLGDNIYTLEH